MAVITISREFGSEGNYIGPQVAKALGYRIVFKHEMKQIFEHYGIIDFEAIHQTRPHFWPGYDEARDESMEFMIEVIRAIASYGNVILMGRCSGAILSTFNDVLNVRIQAPFDVRVQRIRGEHLVDDDNVERFVHTKDQEQARLFENFQCSQWEKANTFDMVVNTGKLSPVLAVRMIVEAARSLEEVPILAEPTTRTIQVSPALSQMVRKVLETLPSEDGVTWEQIEFAYA